MTQLTTLRVVTAALVLGFVTTVPTLADYRTAQELALPPGGELRLRTDSGRVTVRGTDGSTARLVVTSRRDDFDDRFDLTVDETPGTVTITAKRRGSPFTRLFSWGGDSIHFELEVPSETTLDLNTAGGRIDVSEIQASVEARTAGGPITLEEINGKVDARTSGGSISFEGIGGELVAHTSGGLIRGTNVGGDVTAETSGGAIDVRDVAGAVTASTSGGAVTVYFAPGNSHGGSLSTSGGRVTAYVDPAAALNIDASTSSGGVTVDLPITIQGRMSRDAVRGALNGGGAELRLRSSDGSVSVRSL